MAYPVYWTMSVNDYFWASADTALFARFVPDMQHILDSAAAQFWPTNPTLVWMGWDDRLANGWCGTCNEEAQLSFATLLVRAHTDFSRSLMHAGLAALGTQYAATAAKLADVLKRVDSPTERPHHRQPALDPDWAKAYGLHAAANAINAELTSPSEALDLVRRELNDTTTLCSWSPFNQYWNLQALGNAGLMEHALASVRLCWGTQLAMSTGCFLELWNPEWAELLPFGAKTPTRPSYCHPWSSGVTHWLTEAHVGLRPLEPGYRSLLATPHVSPSNPNVAGSVDTPSGPIALEARWRRAGDEADGTGAEGVATGGAIIEVSLDSPVPVLLGLPLTHALPRGGCTLQGFRRGDAAVASKPSAQPPPPTSDATPHPDQPDDPLELRHLDEVLKAAPTQTTVGRLHANVASSLGYSSLISAGRRTVQAVYMGCSAPATPAPSPSPPPLRAEAAARPAEYPPFPPAVWRTNGTLDRTTRGNWVSRGLGKAGYVLFGFDNGTDVSKLPSWCALALSPMFRAPTSSHDLPRSPMLSPILQAPACSHSPSSCCSLSSSSQVHQRERRVARLPLWLHSAAARLPWLRAGRRRRHLLAATARARGPAACARRRRRPVLGRLPRRPPRRERDDARDYARAAVRALLVHGRPLASDRWARPPGRAGHPRARPQAHGAHRQGAPRYRVRGRRALAARVRSGRAAASDARLWGRECLGRLSG